MHIIIIIINSRNITLVIWKTEQRPFIWAAPVPLSSIIHGRQKASKTHIHSYMSRVWHWQTLSSKRLIYCCDAAPHELMKEQALCYDERSNRICPFHTKIILTIHATDLSTQFVFTISLYIHNNRIFGMLLINKYLLLHSLKCFNDNERNQH